MPTEKESVEDLLHKYLLEGGVLKDKLISPNFDFGFIISFPPGSKSQNLSVYKPKNLNSIFITIRFQISQEKATVLNSLKRETKEQFINNLTKYLLIREVLFKINLQKLLIEIHEQIFPDKKGYFSKNSLFKLIQKVFYCYLSSNLLLEEYLNEKKK